MDSSEILKKLERKKKLSPIKRVLAITDGSVTRTLEAYFGGPVGIRTLSQEVKEADAVAKGLGIEKTDLVNFREVEIIDKKGNVLLTAKSLTPLKRLEPGFKEDLMKADVPIGKLLEKHKIEARREIVDASIEGGKVKRVYNIIRKGEILMRIEETIELE